MTVGIVGLGYVGLPLAIAFADAGEHVIGVDLDAAVVEGLRLGASHIEDVAASQIAAVAERFVTTTSYGDLAAADAILICVPTPLSANREPDLGPLRAAGAELGRVVRPGHLVVLESTTYPGTTREQLVPLLEQSGLTAGGDFHVAYSPERVDPGRTDYTIRTTPKIVGGLTAECGDRAEKLYRVVCDELVRVSSPEAAELAKLLENIFRSVNIALVNELAVLTDRMGIDIWEVVDAAGTKPFGFMRFDPGPGMGGHCLPVDPFYLAWKAREYDFATEFIELAGKINQRMPYFVVDRVERALNDAGKPVRGSRVVLLGVAYKPGVADTRESPALKIIELLSRRGADIGYHDALVPELGADGIRSEPLEQLLPTADLAVIVTAQPGIDYLAIAEQAPLLLDLRGVTRGLDSETVIRL